MEAQRTETLQGDAGVFKRNAEVFMRKDRGPGGGGAVLAGSRQFVRDDTSAAAGLVAPEDGGGQSDLGAMLRTAHATAIVRAFDNSVEQLTWDEGAGAFRLKFFGEDERVVSAEAVSEVLSEGAVIGMGLVGHAITHLRIGGFMLIDSIEYGLNRSLIKTLFGLFQSHVSNPKGAQLVFTTHCVELLDCLLRKDNVYLLMRGKGFATDVVRYSDRIRHLGTKKSEVVLANAIRGSMPGYPEVEGLRVYVRECVREQ